MNYALSWYLGLSPGLRGGATGKPSVGPSEGPRERPFGALCTAEAHRLQRTSHMPTGSSPSRICLLLSLLPLLLAFFFFSFLFFVVLLPMSGVLFSLAVLLRPVSRRSLDSSNRSLRATRSTTIPRFRWRWVERAERVERERERDPPDVAKPQRDSRADEAGQLKVHAGFG